MHSWRHLFGKFDETVIRLTMFVFAVIISICSTASALICYRLYRLWYGRIKIDLSHQEAKASSQLDDNRATRKVKKTIRSILLPDVFNDDIISLIYYWRCVFLNYHVYLSCFLATLTSSSIRNQLQRLSSLLRLMAHLWSVMLLSTLTILFLYDSTLSNENCEKDKSKNDCERNPLDIPTDFTFRKFASCEWDSKIDKCIHVDVQDRDYIFSHVIISSFLVMMFSILVQNLFDNIVREIEAYIEARAMRRSRVIVPTNTITIDKSSNISNRVKTIQVINFMNTTSYRNTLYNTRTSKRDQALQLVDWEYLEEYGDEFRLLQSTRSTLLRAARCYLLKKHIDYVPVIEEINLMLSVPRSFKWSAKPESFDGNVNCLNQLKSYYQLTKFKHYATTNPFEARKLLNHCRIQHLPVVIGQIRRCRERAEHLRALLIACTQRDDGDLKSELDESDSRDTLLLKFFMVDWFNGIKHQLAYQLLLETQLTQIVKRNRILSHFCLSECFIYCVIFLAGAGVAFTLYISTLIEDVNGNFWLIVFLLVHLLYVIVVQPLRVLIMESFLPYVFLRKYYLRLFHTMQARWKYILSRESRMVAPRSRLFGLIQHFHPACRVARYFPYLPTARILLSLHDEDLPLPVFFPKHSDRKKKRRKKRRRNEDEDPTPIEQEIMKYSRTLEKMYGDYQQQQTLENEPPNRKRNKIKIIRSHSSESKSVDEQLDETISQSMTIKPLPSETLSTVVDIEAAQGNHTVKSHRELQHSVYTIKREKKKSRLFVANKSAPEMKATNVINNDRIHQKHQQLFAEIQEPKVNNQDEYRPEYKIADSDGLGSPLLKDRLLIMYENWQVRCVYAYHRALHYSAYLLALITQFVFLLPAIGLRYLVFEILIAAFLFALLFIAATAQ